MKIGKYKVVVYVSNVTDNQEAPDAIWLTGEVEILAVVSDFRSRRECRKIQCGCWLDTDDDYVEWNSSHEGASAIVALLGGGDESQVSMLMPDECNGLGDMICSELRAEFRGQEEEETNEHI